MRGLFLGLSLGLACLLAGCANPIAVLEERAPESAADASATQRLADKLFGEAVAPDHRGVRLCMIGSGVIEAMTDRVTHGDADYAPTAFGQVARIRGAVDALDTSAGNIWFETDVKLVILELADMLVEAGQDRVPRLLSTVAGGINPLGLADRARIAGRQGVLADGIVLDIRQAVADLNARTLTVDAADAACRARMDRNEQRLRAILGALPDADRT